LFSVTAEVNSVVVVPLEGGEENRAIWRVVLRDRHIIRQELGHLNAVGIVELIHLLGFIFLSLVVLLLDQYKGWLEGVEVETLIGQDGEFLFILRVVLHLHKALVVARKLCLGQVQQLAFLQVEDGYFEIRHASNQNQILSMSRKSHSEAFECGVHWERVD
jgi:hypothetical protein